MWRVLPTTAAGALAAMLATGSAADTLNTPRCQRDLAMANGLINTIAAREKQFVPGDLAKNCGLLKQNLADMVKAREPMDRCITGHDHGENLAQMDESIGDIRSLAGEQMRAIGSRNRCYDDRGVALILASKGAERGSAG